MKKFIPITDWLPNYHKADFSGDLFAGIIVGVMLVPQGMAYAMLAGLPPIYGLYASTIPLILYAVFGTSRQLSVGPVAMVALLISSGIGVLAQPGTDQYLALVITLSLMVGVIRLLMGLLRMGFLVNFISSPVMAGFTTAAAIYIAFSQFKYLLEVKISNGKVHEVIYQIGSQFNQINWLALLIGLSSIVLILLLRRIDKRIPFPIIVVLIGLAIGYFLNLENYGISLVKEVPSGFPSFGVPTINLETFNQLLPIALTIALVGFAESIAVAKSIQKKHKNYQINPSQELVALGIANIGGAFFQSLPTNGGFSRSAVNDQSGAKTQLSSIISASLVILTLLFLMDYFYYLPLVILASIIIVAVVGLIDIKEIKHLWKTDRKDFYMFLITAIATLALGVKEGIIVGVVISLIALLIRVSYPHIAELGLDPASNTYLNVERFKKCQVNNEMLIVRLDAQLFFANTRFFQDRLKDLEKKRSNLKVVILDARGINGMDSSAVTALSDLVEEYKTRGIIFYMTSVIGPVRDVLRRSGLRSKIGEDNFFLSIEDAISFFQSKNPIDHSDTTLQSNLN
jgi:SulP family sulfate permease